MTRPGAKLIPDAAMRDDFLGPYLEGVRSAAHLVGTQVHYLPINLHAYYQANQSASHADSLPSTLDVYEQEMSIPMCASLADADVRLVIDVLSEVIG